MEYRLIIICGAIILDMILGDPRWFGHPVRLIGALALVCEVRLRKLIVNKRLAGILFTIFIVVITWFSAFLIIKFSYDINRILGLIVSVLLMYTALAIKDLKAHCMRVFDALKENNIEKARGNLGAIVGRDTKNLDEKETVRATVETVAENIVDGIISPLFYGLIGGAPLALAYKAVNTLDSMVGYKNERYKDFGWASARLDDMANFIPARISILIISIASGISGFNALRALKIGLRDGAKNPSPNSGIPEACVAGALGVRLGGMNFYNGAGISKPFIGDTINPLEAGHIRGSVKIAYLSSTVFVLTAILLVSL